MRVATGISWVVLICVVFSLFDVSCTDLDLLGVEKCSREKECGGSENHEQHKGVSGDDGMLCLWDEPVELIEVATIHYPESAMKEGKGGVVLVRVTVGKNGRAIGARIVESTDPVFEKPVIEAVYKFRFKPAMLNGRAVTSEIGIPVKFILE